MGREYIRRLLLAAVITIGVMSAGPTFAHDDDKVKKGKHKGWEKGRHNPHRSGGERRFYVRDHDRLFDDKPDSAEHRRLHDRLQRRHAEWHRRHRNSGGATWEREHQEFHRSLNRAHRQSHRRFYRRIDNLRDDDLRRLVARLNDQHARWHRSNDGRTDPAYQRDHRNLHAELDSYYERMRREAR